MFSVEELDATAWGVKVRVTAQLPPAVTVVSQVFERRLKSDAFGPNRERVKPARLLAPGLINVMDLGVEVLPVA